MLAGVLQKCYGTPVVLCVPSILCGLCVVIVFVFVKDVIEKGGYRPDGTDMPENASGTTEAVACPGTRGAVVTSSSEHCAQRLEVSCVERETNLDSEKYHQHRTYERKSEQLSTGKKSGVTVKGQDSCSPAKTGVDAKENTPLSNTVLSSQPLPHWKRSFDCGDRTTSLDMDECTPLLVGKTAARSVPRRVDRRIHQRTTGWRIADLPGIKAFRDSFKSVFRPRHGRQRFVVIVSTLVIAMNCGLDVSNGFYSRTARQSALHV